MPAGGLTLADGFCSPSLDPLTPDPEMLRQAQDALSTDLMLPGGLPSAGPSLTVDRIVATPAEKAALFRQYHAPAVNMEDYWVAEEAARAGAPFLAVRAVLDPAGQVLPAWVLGLAGRPGTAAGRVLPRPWRIPALFRIAAMRSRAQNSLARFGAAFVQQQQSARNAPPTAL